MIYESENGYFYRIEKGKTRRVCKEEGKRNKNLKKPKIGDIVKIIIKPYSDEVTVNGIVKRVLTKKEIHTRGHKVELRDGTIGRLVKILKSK